MAKILMTGGAGFIGSHVVDAYIEAGHEVVVVDNLESGSLANLNAKARFHQIDLLDPSLEAIIEQEEPSVVNHHAAQVSISKSIADPVNDARTNIIGSVRLLEVARKVAIPNFIFASSGAAIYGVQENYPATEDHPLQPVNGYGIAKLTVERYLEYYRQVHGMRYVTLRYSNVYGPRQDPDGEGGVVAIFIGALLRGGCPVVYGDGRQTRDFVNVRDAVRSNILALNVLLNDGPGVILESPAFNISTGKETNVLQVLAMISSILGRPGDCHFEPPRKGEVRRSVLDYGRAKEVLKWQPNVDLEAGLRDTVHWFLARNA